MEISGHVIKMPQVRQRLMLGRRQNAMVNSRHDDGDEQRIDFASKDFDDFALNFSLQF